MSFGLHCVPHSLIKVQFFYFHLYLCTGNKESEYPGEFKIKSNLQSRTVLCLSAIWNYESNLNLFESEMRHLSAIMSCCLIERSILPHMDLSHWKLTWWMNDINISNQYWRSLLSAKFFVQFKDSWTEVTVIFQWRDIDLSGCCTHPIALIVYWFTCNVPGSGFSNSVFWLQSSLYCTAHVLRDKNSRDTCRWLLKPIVYSCSYAHLWIHYSCI